MKDKNSELLEYLKSMLENPLEGTKEDITTLEGKLRRYEFLNKFSLMTLNMITDPLNERG